MNMFASDAPSVFNPLQQPLPQPKPKGGIFGGGKFGLKEALAFGLAGLVSRRNPALLQGLLAAAMQRQRDAADDQQYEKRRGDTLSDYIEKAKIDAQYNPPNNDTVADYQFISSKLGPEAADQWLRNMGDPIVTTPLPGNRIYSGPRSQLGSALGSPGQSIQPGHVEDGFRFKGGNPADPNAWEPANGGPTPQASGMFP